MSIFSLHKIKQKYDIEFVYIYIVYNIFKLTILKEYVNNTIQLKKIIYENNNNKCMKFYSRETIIIFYIDYPNE